MPASQARVLFYDPKGVAGKAKGVFLRQKIRICPVTPEQAGQTVGFLAGIKGWEAAEPAEPVQPPDASVLVFSGLPGARLDLALAALRRAGVPRSVYRAVVTADNAGWSFAQLCAELERERAAVERGRAAGHPASEAEAGASGQADEKNGKL